MRRVCFQDNLSLSSSIVVTINDAVSTNDTDWIVSLIVLLADRELDREACKSACVLSSTISYIIVSIIVEVHPLMQKNYRPYM